LKRPNVFEFWIPQLGPQAETWSQELEQGMRLIFSIANDLLPLCKPIFVSRPIKYVSKRQHAFASHATAILG
jgi:hypothetical protein